MALGAQVRRPEHEGLKKLALGREQRRDGEACHAKEAASGPSFLRVLFAICLFLQTGKESSVFLNASLASLEMRLWPFFFDLQMEHARVIFQYWIDPSTHIAPHPAHCLWHQPSALTHRGFKSVSDGSGREPAGCPHSGISENCPMLSSSISLTSLFTFKSLVHVAFILVRIARPPTWSLSSWSQLTL